MRSTAWRLDNPIARREWAQWQRGRALWIAPLVLVPALGALLLRFCVDLSAAQAPQVLAGAEQAPGARVLAFVGMVGCALALLLPPSLAAPSIASEREAGLLEGLHLSHLAPREIIAGKWAGAFARSLWLLGAALPVHCAALMFGGVSFGDVLSVWAVEVAFAAFSCALGVFCSAWGRTALSASRSAYGFGVLHAVLCLNALSVASRGQLALVPIPFHFPAWLHPVLHPIFSWMGATHPLAAAGLWLWPEWRVEAAKSGIAPLLAHPVLAWSLALYGCLALALLALACGGVRRPFEAAPFIKPLKRSKKSKASASAPSAWWELPVGFLARGRGPVHQREFASKFRMRAVPRAVLVAEGVLALGVAAFYARAFWLGIFEPGARQLIWWALIMVAAVVGMTSMLVLGATGIAREREVGTWEPLVLSFLSPAEVIRGKVGAMLAASVLFSIPFWPLLALCVRGWRSSPQGIGAAEALCSLAILGAMAFSHAALGLWLSARLPSSGATLCAMAAMFTWDVLVPLAIGSGPLKEPLLALNAAFNPVLALLHLMVARDGQVAPAALPCVLAQTVGGAALLWHLARGLRREWGRL